MPRLSGCQGACPEKLMCNYNLLKFRPGTDSCIVDLPTKFLARHSVDPDVASPNQGAIGKGWKDFLSCVRLTLKAGT